MNPTRFVALYRDLVTVEVQMGRHFWEVGWQVLMITKITEDDHVSVSVCVFRCTRVQRARVCDFGHLCLFDN